MSSHCSHYWRSMKSSFCRSMNRIICFFFQQKMNILRSKREDEEFWNEKMIILRNFDNDLRNDTIIFFRSLYTTNTHWNLYIEVYIFIVTRKLTFLISRFPQIWPFELDTRTTVCDSSYQSPTMKSEQRIQIPDERDHCQDGVRRSRNVHVDMRLSFRKTSFPLNIRTTSVWSRWGRMSRYGAWQAKARQRIDTHRTRCRWRHWRVNALNQYHWFFHSYWFRSFLYPRSDLRRECIGNFIV